jgi:hypothetical protein
MISGVDGRIVEIEGTIEEMERRLAYYTKEVPAARKPEPNSRRLSDKSSEGEDQDDLDASNEA